MTDNLSAALDTILGQIKQDSFGGRDAPIVSVSEGGGVGADGKLRGTILVDILKRDGTMARLHEESLDGIDSIRGLKDVVAETLSKVLASHSKWPR